MADNGTVSVVTKYLTSGEETDETSRDGRIDVGTFEQGIPLATVRREAGMTLNLGNYQSARVDVGVTLPTYVEEIPGALAKAQSIVDGELKRIVGQIRSKGR